MGDIFCLSGRIICYNKAMCCFGDIGYVPLNLECRVNRASHKPISHFARCCTASKITLHMFEREHSCARLLLLRVCGNAMFLCKSPSLRVISLQLEQAVGLTYTQFKFKEVPIRSADDSSGN